MIDFEKSSYPKLHRVNDNEFHKLIAPMLIQGEREIFSFKTLRDGVVFTNYRIISINVQGVTGSKKDFTSLPYKKMQVFSVTSTGAFDLDSEIEIFFVGLGKVKFEFFSGTDISELANLISQYVLLG